MDGEAVAGATHMHARVGDGTHAPFRALTAAPLTHLCLGLSLRDSDFKHVLHMWGPR